MRKTERNLVIIMSALALAFICVRANAATQQGKEGQVEHATKHESAPDLNNYRVSYKVDELENGKTVNSRSYTLMVKTGSSATLRVGSRVSYPTSAGGQFQFQDIGMNIHCKLSREEGRMIVGTKIDMSTVHRSKAQSSSEISPPVFAQFQVENNTVATLGKPEFVGSADDMASNRHYEILVTVTKAK